MVMAAAEKMNYRGHGDSTCGVKTRIFATRCGYVYEVLIDEIWWYTTRSERVRSVKVGG